MYDIKWELLTACILHQPIGILWSTLYFKNTLSKHSIWACYFGYIFSDKRSFYNNIITKSLFPSNSCYFTETRLTLPFAEKHKTPWLPIGKVHTLLKDVPIMHWDGCRVSGTAVQYQPSGSAIGEAALGSRGNGWVWLAREKVCQATGCPT